MILIDANLLVYAYDRNSPQYQRAYTWLDEVLSGNTPIGLPWLVIIAFLRISTHDRIMPNPLRPEQALSCVDAWLKQPYVTLLQPGERHWAIMQKLLHESGTAGNLTNDAHIAAIAIEHGYTVYSADNDFKRFAGLQHINPLETREVHETTATYRKRRVRSTG
jgi:toxin-antitoxin system PIN domain toxin